MPFHSKLDAIYIKMCHVWSSLSRAKRKKVGCLIVKNGSIISDGYNGTPKGFSNECEVRLDEHDPNALLTKPEVLHAESTSFNLEYQELFTMSFMETRRELTYCI